MALFAVSGVDMGHPGIGLRSAVGNGIRDSRSRTFLLPWGFSLGMESSRSGWEQSGGFLLKAKIFPRLCAFTYRTSIYCPGPTEPSEGLNSDVSARQSSY